jgi:ketosteroid isomerase-like protein
MNAKSKEWSDMLAAQNNSAREHCASNRVRSCYQLVDLRDFGALMDLFAEDAEYHRPGYQPIRGRAQLRSFYQQERVIETGVHVVEHLLICDDNIAARGSFAGVLKDRTEVLLQFVDFRQFRQNDQPFVRRTSYFFVPMV